MTLARQVYLGLPDGQLAGNFSFEAALNEIAHDFGPDRIFTTGSIGYDGHPDHIAAHAVALGSAALLSKTGADVQTWALHETHEGELHTGGYYARKTGAMALHTSQIVGPQLTSWGNTDFYTPLIVGGETFTRVEPAIGRVCHNVYTTTLTRGVYGS